MGEGKRLARRKEDERQLAAAGRGEERQSAEVELRIGEHAGLSVRVSVTPGGLMAIGGLVSGILLSTAVIVRTAKRRRDALPPPPLLRLPQG